MLDWRCSVFWWKDSSGHAQLYLHRDELAFGPGGMTMASGALLLAAACTSAATIGMLRLQFDQKAGRRTLVVVCGSASAAIALITVAVSFRL
jgi:hypothetical protein